MAVVKQLTSITHRGVRELNEDALLINEAHNIFGVFDGASSLDNFLSDDGKTGAYIASRLAAETFRTGIDLKTAALKANSNIQAVYERLDIDVADNVNRFGTTAAVVRIARDRVEILQIGDSIVMFILKDGSVVLPLGYHDHDLEVMRRWRKLADQGKKDIRKIVASKVVELRRQANKDYGMLNGNESLKNFITTTETELTNIRTVILLTDGMFLPKQNPDEDEDWSELARLYLDDGLEGIYERVRSLEKSDPDLLIYPRYKLHDDASAIALDFV